MNTARILRGNVSLDRLMSFRARFGYAPRIKPGLSVPEFLRLVQVALDTDAVPGELQPGPLPSRLAPPPEQREAA